MKKTALCILIIHIRLRLKQKDSSSVWAKRTACWAHICRYLTDAIPKVKQLDYTSHPLLYSWRKNWLFCDTPNGAQASAIVYTMIEMAKTNGVNVYHYLIYLLKKLTNDKMSDEELDMLAPWNEDVNAGIARRANSSDQYSIICELSRCSGYKNVAGYFFISG